MPAARRRGHVTWSQSDASDTWNGRRFAAASSREFSNCPHPGLGLEYVALASPESYYSRTVKNANIPFSAACRFALSASLYLLIALFQVVLQKFIYERFYEDKLQHFIDLCSVSNEDLCGHRGLLPDTEQQTFQMTLPVHIYEQYCRMRRPLSMHTQGPDRMKNVDGHLSRVNIDTVVNIYNVVTKFLCAFLDHSLKDVDYTVKDRTLLEKLLDIEFNDIVDRGFFYNDNGHSFDAVIYHGHEFTLVLWDLLMFCVVDFASSDFVLAATLTYIVDKSIAWTLAGPKAQARPSPRVGPSKAFSGEPGPGPGSKVWAWAGPRLEAPGLKLRAGASGCGSKKDFVFLFVVDTYGIIWTSHLNRQKCKAAGDTTAISSFLSEKKPHVPSTVKGKLTTACVKWCAKYMRPVDVVCDEGFLNVADELIAIGTKYGSIYARTVIPHPTAVSRRVTEVANELREVVMPEIQSAIQEGC
ncbi:hypothetical protein HPB51_018458 [Rhipicephalus microplus]|uniref:Uncharacterized protein n=1 Tax=Rhipicephalus microplus TaxID=6941 RepID=A0A9J6DAU8_RHIMP|nr:hypothetical protein HPB51_018458 [Rhipicephalus microplus]